MARLKGRDTSSDVLGGRRSTWIISAVVVGIIVVLGIVVLLPNGKTANTGGATQSPAPAATATAVPTQTDAAGSSGCDVPAGSQALPKSAPADLTWDAAYGNTWPVSKSVGPTVSTDHVGTCFARSPMGAALAAVNILETSRVLDRAAATEVMKTEYVQNEGLSVAMAAAKKKLFPIAPADRTWGRETGFNIQSYTPDRATVTVVENWPQRGSLSGNNVTLVWQDNDWKIELNSDGSTGTTSDFAVDEGSFVPWGDAD